MLLQDLYAIYRQHTSIQTDTRKLQPGDLFFALKGPNYNGNLFAQQALQAGAAYVVVDEPTNFTSDKIIQTSNVLHTLQALAKYHRQQLNIPFIAITGSNGKTTTKELLHQVLSTTYITYTTVGNLNNHIGVPLTILSVQPNAQIHRAGGVLVVQGRVVLRFADDYLRGDFGAIMQHLIFSLVPGTQPRQNLGRFAGTADLEPVNRQQMIA